MLDLEALRRRLAAAGTADPAGSIGTVPPEAIAAPVTADDATDLVTRPLVPAAVLVPIVHGLAPGVLLTKRTSHLKAHAGQVAFPGGRIEPDDPSVEHAALREAEEEIGLRPDHVELAGRLPDYVTGTGYRVSPVLALMPDGLSLVANPDEVEAIFTLPLTTLLDPKAPELRRAHFRGRLREFWVWPHEEHYVWGVTAGILVTLARRLRSSEALAL